MADLVIDASLASAWCFPNEQTEYTNGVLQAVSDSLEAYAPRLWAYEVYNSILMGLRRGRISRVDAQRFLDSLIDLNIHLADPVSYDAIFKLAELHGLTVYDAAYLDLAIREGSQLATLDAALRKAALNSGVVLFKLSGQTV
jgi:predicted nucleic acid-binding protein